MKERGCGLDKRKRQIAARLKALAMTGERGSGSRGQGIDYFVALAMTNRIKGKGRLPRA
jgi:hypothetical protein